MQLTLDDGEIDRLAEVLAVRIFERIERLHDVREDRWLDSRQAAEHLGLSLHALRHLVTRRAMPYVQDKPGSKIFFRASELDAWRAEQAHDVPVNGAAKPLPRCSEPAL